DGSGNYSPMSDVKNYNPMLNLLFSPAYKGDQFKKFRQTLEQDQDPVIRLYARAGRVTMSMQGDDLSDGSLAAAHEFRLYAQDLLVHGEAAKSVPFRNQVWF